MGLNVGRHGIVFLLAIAITFWKISKNGHHFFPNQNEASGLFSNFSPLGGDGFESVGASHDWTLVKAALQKRLAPFMHEIEIYDSRSNAGVGGRLLTVIKRPSAVFCGDQCNSLASPPVVLATIHEKDGNQGLYGDFPVGLKSDYASKRGGQEGVGAPPNHPKSVAEKRKQRMARLNKKKLLALDDKARAPRSAKAAILNVFEWMLHLFSPGYEYGYSELDEVRASAQYERENSHYNQQNIHDTEFAKNRNRQVPKGRSRGKAAKAFATHPRGRDTTTRTNRGLDSSLKPDGQRQVSLSLQLHVHLTNVTCVLEKANFPHAPSSLEDPERKYDTPSTTEIGTFERSDDEISTSPQHIVEPHVASHELQTDKESEASPERRTPLIDALRSDPNTSQFLKDSLTKAQKPNLARRIQKQLAQDVFVINNEGNNHLNLEILRSKGIDVQVGNSLLPECVDIHAQWVRASQSDVYLLNPLFLTPFLPPGSNTAQTGGPIYLETEIADVLHDLMIDVHALGLVEILDPFGNRIVRSSKFALDTGADSGGAEDRMAADNPTMLTTDPKSDRTTQETNTIGKEGEGEGMHIDAEISLGPTGDHHDDTLVQKDLDTLSEVDESLGTYLSEPAAPDVEIGPNRELRTSNNGYDESTVAEGTGQEDAATAYERDGLTPILETDEDADSQPPESESQASEMEFPSAEKLEL